MTLPTVITKAGLTPQSPADLRAQLIALAVAADPGLTANLPGSLIEDIASTQVAGLTLIDSARVDTVDSLTPYSANAFLLNELGQIYGVQQGLGTTTSVYVVFTGTVGFPIGRGFTVSDGSNQYIVQDGGIVQTGGTTDPLFCLATNAGSFAVPANTVTTLITSVPGTITLSCTNPQEGLPGAGAQSEGDYRGQVLQAGLAAGQGMPTFLKTLVGQVTGVQPRLVSMRQANGGWEVIVGGGDPYAVAYAIFQALFDINTLAGSTISITAITKANPGVATTDLNHGLVTGQNNVLIANAAGGGFTAANGGPYTVTVLDEKRFSFGVNTSGYSGTYTASSGTVTPNARNVVVSVNDYPDTYPIPFVVPPQQSVSIGLTWNTISTNSVSATAVAQLGAQAISDYVNSIPVGSPINLFELQSVFQLAVADLIPTALLSRMVFTVSINGVPVTVDAGTGLFDGDPESFFAMSPSDCTITQG